MAKYLIKGTYSVAGTNGILKEGGSSRRRALEQMAQGLGGKLEAFYFTFGEADAIAIIDAPDATTAAAVGLAVNSTGAVRASTTPLLTAEEVDAACGKSVDYRAPGA